MEVQTPQHLLNRFRTRSQSPTPNSRPYRSKNPADLTTYIEQARSALENQRLSFEAERKAFAEERKLWQQERTIMQQKIAELEEAGSKAGFHIKPDTTAPGVEEQHYVWEGSSPMVRPTRVFRETPQNDASPDALNLDLPPSLDGALSPKSRQVDRSSPVGVPIELLDSTLDGITLKSTALPPDIAVTISPPMSATSAPPNQPIGTEPKTRPPQELRCLASPLSGLPGDLPDTPLTPLKQIVEDDFPLPISESIDDETPREPLPSLFPVASIDTAAYLKEPDYDPALRGPLNLQNDHKQDLEFLEELDEKLLNEAKKALAQPALSSDGEDEGEGLAEPPEPEPEIRFKQSTNFGSAFGSTRVET